MRPLGHQLKIAVLENSNNVFIITFPCTSVALLSLSDTDGHTRLMVWSLEIYHSVILIIAIPPFCLFEKEVLYFSYKCSLWVKLNFFRKKKSRLICFKWKLCFFILLSNTAEPDWLYKDITSTHASLYLFSQFAQPVWLTAGPQTEVTEAIKVCETERKGKKENTNKEALET